MDNVAHTLRSFADSDESDAACHEFFGRTSLLVCAIVGMLSFQASTCFAETNTITVSNLVELARFFGVTNLSPLIPSNYSGEVTIRPLEPEELEDFSEKMQASSDGRKLVTNPPTMFRIDGQFDDWKQYYNGWTAPNVETNSDKQQVISESAVFQLTQCSYCNDSNYLYLFLKLTPSIQARQDVLAQAMSADGRLRHLGDIVWLYFDRDNNPETGAQLNIRGLQGTDTYVEISGASSFYFRGRGSLSFPCEVAYAMHSFDVLAGGFRVNGVARKSMTTTPLIKSGADGLEIAFLLSDLNLKRGDKVALIGKEAERNGRSHRVVIEFK